ncbi:MAG: ComEA family DNA-binding protein [Leptolyngbyaceae cyanobacterium SM1_3_5]|nr:ComEA family DNA-binding protein [Leptolyngbyaceae cyanobacterium SM1_3_5]
MGFSRWFASSPSPLWQRIKHDPFYRLQSISEVQLAIELGVRIDVNRASMDDWLRLPGISIHQARSIAALTQSGVQLFCLEDVAAALDVPVSRLESIAPILQFCYYDAIAPETMNANTAAVELLTRIPAVDLYLARAIVEGRRLGKYRNLADLQQRLNLPPQLTAELLHYLRFE